jgi:ribosomal protein S18 acetylase RimI-like enzyme
MPDHPFPIRPAETADIPAVLALWEAARSAHATARDTPEALARLLDAAPGALIVALDDEGATIGALIAAWDGWRGSMYRLAVAPGHRRRGVARALVAAGERRLRDVGARRITALVAHDDDVATALWTAAGYAFDREIGRFVRSLGPAG